MTAAQQKKKKRGKKPKLALQQKKERNKELNLGTLPEEIAETWAGNSEEIVQGKRNNAHE